MDEPATCAHEWVPNGIIWEVGDGPRLVLRFFRCPLCGEERERRGTGGACACIGSEEPGFPYCACGLPMFGDDRGPVEGDFSFVATKPPTAFKITSFE